MGRRSRVRVEAAEPRAVGRLMRTQIAKVLVFMVFAWTGSAGEFDHEAYVKTTLDEIFATAPKIEEGADLFFKKRQFEVTLVSVPEKVSNGWITVVFRTLGITDPPPVNHAIKVRSASGKVVEMYVQDVLVEAILNEVGVGTRFNAYALYLFYNGHSRQPGFVLSEFEVLEAAAENADPTQTEHRH